MKNKNLWFDRLLIEVYGYLFTIGMFIGIWVQEIRWRAISTALFCLFLAFIYTNSIIKKEKDKK